MKRVHHFYRRASVGSMEKWCTVNQNGSWGYTELRTRFLSRTRDGRTFSETSFILTWHLGQGLHRGNHLHRGKGLGWLLQLRQSDARFGSGCLNVNPPVCPTAKSGQYFQNAVKNSFSLVFAQVLWVVLELVRRRARFQQEIKGEM